MADKKENTLTAQAEIDVTTDFIRMLDDNGLSYKNPFGDVAAAMIEQYEGISLELGQSDTIASVFADIDSRVKQNASNIVTNASAIASNASKITAITALTATDAELDALIAMLGI